MDIPGWSFGLASSSLVGQYLGTGNEFEAGAYGRDILRFAVTLYLFVVVIVFYAELLLRAAESVCSPLGWRRDRINRFLADRTEATLSAYTGSKEWQ